MAVFIVNKCEKLFSERGIIDGIIYDEKFLFERSNTSSHKNITVCLLGNIQKFGSGNWTEDECWVVRRFLKDDLFSIR